MAQEKTLDQRLMEEAGREGGKRLLWWLLGGGLAVVGPVLIVIIVVIAGVGLLAGIGYWAASLFGPSPPAIATPLSRPAEWLLPVEVNATQDGIPNVVALAVINAASDGQAYGDRFYCSNGRSAGEKCSTAFPPTKGHVGPHGIKLPGSKGSHTLGIGYGLMGLGSQSGLIPKNQNPHSVKWNVTQGMHSLGSFLVTGYWHTDLNAFHQAAQTPQKGWTPSGHYATQIKGLVRSYEAGPTLGAWALASWSHKTGQFQDPGKAPEWVFVVGTAPTGAPFSHVWKAPTTTVTYNPRTRKSTRTVVHHILRGHDVASPVLVVGTLKNGQKVAFDLSTQNKNVPVWAGGTVFGGQVPLTGPKGLTSITAYWTNGISDTIQWPEQSGGTVSTVTHIPPTQTLSHWWADIQSASQKTGVPADWIAAEMLNESGGQPGAGQNGLAGAFGLMQLEPGTAKGLPGWYPGARSNPQENLILGAELLAENHSQFGSWRIASAAYYGGSGSVQNDGVTPGMSWTIAGPKLATVPFASAGNSLTMQEYANNIEATSQAVANKENTKHATKHATTTTTGGKP